MATDSPHFALFAPVLRLRGIDETLLKIRRDKRVLLREIFSARHGNVPDGENFATYIAVVASNESAYLGGVQRRCLCVQ